jgi:hypothetical protein
VVACDRYMMRPQFILLVLVVALAFLLVLMISPGSWNRMALDKAVSAWVENRTIENERAIQVEKTKARRSQDVLCALVVLNVAAIIAYGGWQSRKGAFRS